MSDREFVHRRNSFDGPKCGRSGKIFGYGTPTFPYPADFGVPEEQRKYEWCPECLYIIQKEKSQ